MDHADATDPNDALNLTFQVKATDADGDSAVAKVDVKVLDDGPSIDGMSVFPVAESGLENGPVVVSRNLSGGDFGEDGPGGYEFDGTFMLLGKSSTATTNDLTSNGELVDVTFNNNVATGTSADGRTVFTMELNEATGRHTFTLFEPLDHAKTDASGSSDVVWVKFGVDIVDADGDRASTTIQVDIRDDAPDAIDDTNTVDEGQMITGNVIDNDEVGGDTPGSVTMINGENVGANGKTIQGQFGTLVIQQDGSYKYTANSNNPEGMDSFTYKLSDNDGDTDTATLKITVSSDNDVPTIVGTANAVDETNLENGPIGFTKSYTFDYGDDGAGSIMANGEFMAKSTMNGGAVNLTSGGQPVVVTSDADGYVGKVGSDVIFTVDLSVDGQYTYNQVKPIDHFDATDPDDVIWLTFGVKITDSDGDVAKATLTVDVHDDGPTAGPMSVFPVNEAGLDDGVVQVSRDLNGGDFGEDGAGQYEFNGTFMLLGKSSTATTNDLTSNGYPVDVTFNGNVATGKANGNTVFTMTLNEATGRHTFKLFEPLDHGKADVTGTSDVVWVKFGVDIVDADGDRASTTIQVDIRDDGPDAKDDTDSAGEGQTVTGNVITNDDVGADTPGKITMINGENIGTGGKTIAGQYGTLTINQNGSYSYKANSNNPDGVDTFTYKLRDFDGDTDTAQLKITVSPDNDVPVVTNAANTVDETDGFDMVTGNISVNYGNDTPGATMATGAFSASDATLTSLGQAVTVSRSGNTYTGTAGGRDVFKMVINANGTYKFTQLDQLDHPDASNANDNIALRFGVKATDGDGSVGTGTVTINVRDDGPDAVNDTRTANEGQTISGSVITNDDVGADAPGTITMINGQNIGSTGKTIVGQYGTLTIKQNGSYSYKANSNNPDGVDTFTYKLRDFDGDTDTAQLKITVTSQNDIPEGKDDFCTIVLPNGTFSSNVLANDNFKADGPGSVKSVIFNGKTFAIAAIGLTEIALTHGKLSIAADGDYTFKVNNVNAAPTFSENLQIVIQDKDGDTDTTKLQLNIVGKDLEGTDGRDTIFGSSADDVINGNGGADEINGRQGNDKINGGAGDDDLFGADGNDIIRGDAGQDVIYGDNGNDTLYGGDGNDSLYGDGGAQDPTSGNDTLYGNDGNDFLFGGRGKDTLYGGTGNDDLYGGDGDDTLIGGAGLDYLLGQNGNDTLTGGGGADTFWFFSTANAGIDTITDFKIGEGDALELSNVISNYNETQDAINDFVFTRSSGGNTNVFVDNSGSGNINNATQIAVLEDVDLNVNQLFNNGAIIH